MPQYLLEEGQLVPVSLLTWARWFETADRVVERTTIQSIGKETITVSTVFIGLNELLWETMIFGGPLDQETSRSSTEADAKQAHLTALARVGRLRGRWSTSP
jgi:hypothetical protein